MAMIWNNLGSTNSRMGLIISRKIMVPNLWRFNSVNITEHLPDVLSNNTTPIATQKKKIGRWNNQSITGVTGVQIHVTIEITKQFCHIVSLSGWWWLRVLGPMASPRSTREDSGAEREVGSCQYPPGIVAGKSMVRSRWKWMLFVGKTSSIHVASWSFWKKMIQKEKHLIQWMKYVDMGNLL